MNPHRCSISARLFVALTFAAGLLVPFVATAQAPFWQSSTGPNSGRVWSLRTAPNLTMFIIAFKRTYRSTDGGAHWEWIGQSLGYTRNIFGTRSGALIAVTESDYPDAVVMRSTDNGDSWAPIDTFASLSGGSIATDSDGILYYSGKRLFRSIDDGMSWQQEQILPSSIISMHSLSPDPLLVVSSESGIYLSRDSGLTSVRIDTTAIDIIRQSARARSGELFAIGDSSRRLTDC